MPYVTLHLYEHVAH